MKHSCASVFPAPGTCKTPQLQATAMCCGQLQHAEPRQGLDHMHTDPDPAVSTWQYCFRSSGVNLTILFQDQAVLTWRQCFFSESLNVGLFLLFRSSYQGEVSRRAGGWGRQRHLWKPHQADQVRDQTNQGTRDGITMSFFMLGHKLELSVNLNVLLSVWTVRCSKDPARISMPSTPLPLLPCAEWLWRPTARSISSQV